MVPQRCSLLIVDDDPAVLAMVSRIAEPDFEVITAGSAEAAQASINRTTINIILADQKLPEMSGVQLLEWVRHQSPKTIRLLMTGFAKFEDAVQAINRGQVYRYLLKPWRPEDLQGILQNAARTILLEQGHERLLAELQQLNLDLELRVQKRTRELEETNHHLQQRNAVLQKLALTDPLTCLPNRRAMDQLAIMEIRRRMRYPFALSLGLVDVDHFKEINSRYLLPGGDQVLVELAKTFIDSLRTVDTVGRIGGDEFMVVAPETDEAGVAILAERIRAAVEKHAFTYHDSAIAVTVSIGFGVVDAPTAIDADQLKHIAASALEEAKRQGRNRCVIRPVRPANNVDDPHSHAVESFDAGT